VDGGLSKLTPRWEPGPEPWCSKGSKKAHKSFINGFIRISEVTKVSRTRAVEVVARSDKNNGSILIGLAALSFEDVDSTGTEGRQSRKWMGLPAGTCS
jgi:hypothetical protein